MADKHDQPSTRPVSPPNTIQPGEQPTYDEFYGLGGTQGREPYRITEGDPARYVGGPGFGNDGYGAGGHGPASPQDIPNVESLNPAKTDNPDLNSKDADD